MIGHLGARVSALLDGRLPPAEEERAWEHVHACHPCRDLVEREGWVKTRLAGMTCESVAASDSFKHHLLAAASLAGCSSSPVGAGPVVAGEQSFLVRHRAVMALGSGALGVAVLGVAALSAVPANAPQLDRRAPATSLVRPASTSTMQVVRGRVMEREVHGQGAQGERTGGGHRGGEEAARGVNGAVQTVRVRGRMAP